MSSLKNCPKPTKLARDAERARRRQDLYDYRRVQYRLANRRDGGHCVICGNRGMDIHHVYGRGREAGDWREHYSKLMVVCRSCHPLPIVGDKAGKNLEWVEELLEEIND